MEGLKCLDGGPAPDWVLPCCNKDYLPTFENSVEFWLARQGVLIANHFVPGLEVNLSDIEAILWPRILASVTPLF